MYFVELFAVPPLRDDDVDRMVTTALDADVEASARIAAFHRLRGAGASRHAAIASALVRVLNEPLNWIASEALMCVDALARDLPIGVDKRGLFVPSATPTADLTSSGPFLHCADLGAVVTPRELGALPQAPSLPWLARREAQFVVSVSTTSSATPQRFAFRTGEPISIGTAIDARIRLSTGIGRQAVLHGRAGDVVLLPVEGVRTRVNGSHLGLMNATRRLLVGDVIDIDDVALRIERIDDAASMPGSLDIEHQPVAVGDARTFGALRCHIAVLGPRDVGVVAADGVARFQWQTIVVAPLQLGGVAGIDVGVVAIAAGRTRLTLDAAPGHP